MMTEGEKKKRKSPERTGPIIRRELTQVRDEVGEVRDLARAQGNERAILESIGTRCDALYTKLDRMDLRFKLHHDGEKKAK
jgi:hypothetical protein